MPAAAAERQEPPQVERVERVRRRRGGGGEEAPREPTDEASAAESHQPSPLQIAEVPTSLSEAPPPEAEAPPPAEAEAPPPETEEPTPPAEARDTLPDNIVAALTDAGISFNSLIAPDEVEMLKGRRGDWRAGRRLKDAISKIAEARKAAKEALPEAPPTEEPTPTAAEEEAPAAAESPTTIPEPVRREERTEDLVKILSRAYPTLPTELNQQTIDAYLEAMKEAHAFNIAAVVGSDGLLQQELERAKAKLDRIQTREPAVRERIAQYTSGFLREAQVVTTARAELATAQQKEAAWRKARKAAFQAENITPARKTICANLYTLNQLLEAEPPVMEEVSSAARQLKWVDIFSNLPRIEERLITAKTVTPEYSVYKVFEDGGTVTIKGRQVEVQPGSSLRSAVTAAKEKLQKAQKRADAAKKGKGIKGISRKIDQLAAKMDQLSRISDFVSNEFPPDRDTFDAIESTLDELGEARKKLTNAKEAIEAVESSGYKPTREMTKDRKKYGDVVARLQRQAQDMYDPRARLAKCKELARGLALFDQEELDPTTLSAEDRLQLAVVQTLLGEHPVELAAAPVPPAPAEPSAGEEEPLPEPPAGEREAPEEEKLSALGPDDLHNRVQGLLPGEVADVAKGNLSFVAEVVHLLRPEQVAELPAASEESQNNAKDIAETLTRERDRILKAGKSLSNVARGLIERNVERGNLTDDQLPEIAYHAVRQAITYADDLRNAARDGRIADFTAITELIDHEKKVTRLNARDYCSYIALVRAIAEIKEEPTRT